MTEVEFNNWLKQSNTFVSKPFFKFLLKNGLGLYFLNAYKFNYIPKFYFSYYKKSHLETGGSWLGVNVEIMWNKAFEQK